MSRLYGHYVESDPASVRDQRHKKVSEHLEASAANQSGKNFLVVRGIFNSVTWTLHVPEPHNATEENLTKLIKSALVHADSITNPSNPKSDLYQLNSSPVGKVTVVSPDLWEILTLQRNLVAVTGGIFDPAICPRWRIAKDYVRRGLHDSQNLPTCNTMAQSFSFEGDLFVRKVTRLHDEAEIDLGASSKGYAVDAVCRTLSGAGYRSFLFEYGNTRKVLGTHPWVFPIALSDGTKLRAMPLTDGMALSISSDTAHRMYNTTALPIMGPTSWFRESHPDSIGLVAVTSCSAAVASALCVTGMLLNDVDKVVEQLTTHWTRSLTPVFDAVIYVDGPARLCTLQDTSFEEADARRAALRLCTTPKVAIVGGGIAGMCAALEAAACGAKVTLLESSRDGLGGTAMKAWSGITAMGTAAQRRIKVSDSHELLLADSGDRSLWTNQTRRAITWLTQMTPPLEVVCQAAGHSVPRVHSFAQKPFSKDFVPFGRTLVESLHAAVKKCPDNIVVHIGAQATGLVQETLKEDIEDRMGTHIIGVVYEIGRRTVEMHCEAVILCAGSTKLPFVPLEWISGKEGFAQASSPPRPSVLDATCESPRAQISRSVSMRMGAPQTMSSRITTFVDDNGEPTVWLGCGPGAFKQYFPTFILFAGAILVDHTGKRFVDEKSSMETLCTAVSQQSRVTCIVNSSVRENLPFPLDRVLPMKTVSSLDDLAISTGAKADALVALFAELQASGTRPFSPEDSTFQITPIGVLKHGNTGGICVLPSGEICPAKRLIGGILAAGDAVNASRRLEGNALLGAIIRGRAAGYRAATIKQRKPTCLSSAEFVRLEVSDVQTLHNECFALSVRHSGALQTSGVQVGQYVEIRRNVRGRVIGTVCGMLTRPEGDRGTLTLCLLKKDALHTAIAMSCTDGTPVELRVAGNCFIERRRPGECRLNGKGLFREATFVCSGLHAVVLILSAVKGLLAPPYGERTRGVRVFASVETDAEKAFVEALCEDRATASLISFVEDATAVDVLSIPSPASDHAVFVCCVELEEQKKIKETLVTQQGHDEQMVTVWE